ncbi:8-oxo-dGTP diphosphatase [Thermosporothrix hazakensis]|jgi:8-oxo-dGTP pyrophosphatase MutT (NUDIX family)|uniref:8-oxo-dGTP diphosphatase n=2 Tax=Thermosporothrix TaxID=768650 RepID=A0A326U631_THEHA|nr:NUDIX domain-containing protein [Thermosporothrix hazakensis]PZW29411.1 8-oxo-dGTP diphosphatase [Thermosporothrix hazakensis]BBH85698.1 DNA mismatch repair protein MutT [Thermosporothrix sp. COM3]GCE45873.1 DNA mismatch repair protein MutT [Thermosporothrix hazakensis]
MPQHIYTVGLLLLRQNQVLLVRKRNTIYFMLPGGKIDPGETELASLAREIQEELLCQVVPETLHFLGDFTEIAANEPDAQVHMKLYSGQVSGEIQPAREIAEVSWFDPHKQQDILLAPLVKKQVLPFLLEQNALTLE